MRDKIMSVVLFLILGLGIGLLSGMLGIGGGILLVPGLMWLGGIEEQRRAAGISLAVLTPPIVLPAVWRYYQNGFLTSADLGLAAIIAAAFAVGSYFGAYLLNYLSVTTLRFVFGLMLMMVGVRFLLLANTEVASAFYGLLAAGLAWLGYLGLRAVGRRHMLVPDLGEKVRSFQNRSREGSDYSI
jgi:uncharacterized membrane protein YfcA